MKLKFSPKEEFPGRGPCIQLYGDWVTEDVWNAVAAAMRDNWMDSPVYQARSKCGAFFQGGSDNPRGKWVLLEFWSSEDKCSDFVKLLEEAVNKAITNIYYTTIALVSKTSNGSDVAYIELVCDMIAEQTNCPFERNAMGARVLFQPEDNVAYSKVLNFVKEFKLEYARVLDKWEVELT